VRERYADATLIDVRVRTGRTHQIRVHLADEGHPVIGDAVYSREGAASKAQEIRFSRHALHAHSLAFKHPTNGNRIFYRSPLPKDMQDLVDRLREGS
jgi:23S rRNA pseudouridine1911/1915/1917 synthase